MVYREVQKLKTENHVIRIFVLMDILDILDIWDILAFLAFLSHSGSLCLQKM